MGSEVPARGTPADPKKPALRGTLAAAIEGFADAAGQHLEHEILTLIVAC
jgi:hypothetical protein